MVLTTQTRAKLASIVSGLVFGIYWIPLRAIDGAGFDGIWAIVLFNLVGFGIVLPWAVYRWREFIPGRLRLHVNTIGVGVSFVLYAGAFLYTEVIRAIILFYLMPIWGFLIARLVTGEKITAIRWVSMALGLGGLIVICGIEQGIPLPANAGDWMALGAGMLWAGVSTMILTDRQDTVNYTIGFLFWAAIISVIFAVVATRYGILATPDWPRLTSVLPWLIPFTIVFIIPGAFATMYGPSQLNPGVVGLFFMIEISVGATTAAWFANEPFGATQITGVALITLAGMAETLYQWLWKKPVAPA